MWIDGTLVVLNGFNFCWLEVHSIATLPIPLLSEYSISTVSTVVFWFTYFLSNVRLFIIYKSVLILGSV